MDNWWRTLIWITCCIGSIWGYLSFHNLGLIIFWLHSFWNLYSCFLSFVLPSLSTFFIFFWVPQRTQEAISTFSRSGKVVLWCVYHMLLTSTLLSIHEIGWRCIYLSLDRVVTQFWVIVVFPKSVSKCSLILMQSKWQILNKLQF